MSNSSHASLGIGVLALVLALAGMILPESSPIGSFAPYPSVGVYSFPSLAIYNDVTAKDVSINVLHAQLYIVSRRVHIDSLRVYIATAGFSGWKMRLGIYSDSGTVYPDQLIVDAGEVVADSVGFKSLNVSVWLDSGYYWFVFNANGVPVQTAQLFYSPSFLFHIVETSAYRKAYTYGSLPSSYPSGAIYGDLFMVYWRVSEYS